MSQQKGIISIPVNGKGMAYQLKINQEGDILMARASGQRTRQAVLAMAMEILKVCIERQCSKVLVDVRELEGFLDTLNSYQVATDDLSKMRGKGLNKAAIVDRKRGTETHRFFETVARNRGFNLRMFINLKDAIVWLRK